MSYVLNIYKKGTFKYLNNLNSFEDMPKTITVNIEEQIESEFRKQAIRKYGKQKGYLGKAFAEAMTEWTKKADADIVNQGLKLLKEGVEGKKWKFNRAELHER